jgi:hypothetical protein
MVSRTDFSIWQDPKSYRNFTPKKRLRISWTAPKSSCRICVSYDHFPPTPCLVHRADAKPSVFREGNLFPYLLYTKAPSLLSRGSDSLASISCDFSLRLKLPAPLITIQLLVWSICTENINHSFHAWHVGSVLWSPILSGIYRYTPSNMACTCV